MIFLTLSINSKRYEKSVAMDVNIAKWFMLTEVFHSTDVTTSRTVASG